MMRKILLPLTIFSSIGWMLYQHSNKVPADLTYKIVSTSIDKADSSNDSLSMTVSIAISNPSTADLPFKSLFAKIVYQGKTIGNISFRSNVTVKASQVTVITVPLDIENTAAATAILSRFTAGQTPTVIISGRVGFLTGSLTILTRQALQLA